MDYRLVITEDTAIGDNIFHSSQDYENRLN